MGITAAIASVAIMGTGGAMLGSSMSQKPDAPPPIPSTADNAANADAEAVKAAEKRKKLYAGVGRSSTILTGPSGLGAVGTENKDPKQLLGL